MRSKTLIVSNILSTAYACYLLWYFGGAIVSAGGVEYLHQAFGIVFDLVGFDSVSVNIIYAIVVLLGIHICSFTLGIIFGWSGYLAKKSGLAKSAAVLYLVGTICFPIYIVFGLPLTIIGFVGGSKQKKLNEKTV